MALTNYVKWMRGVDKSNQFNSYYNIKHKSKKWWRGIWNSLLDTSISNAYILYKQKYPTKINCQLKFREQLIFDICDKFITNKGKNNPARLIHGLHQIGLRQQKIVSFAQQKS